MEVSILWTETKPNTDAFTIDINNNKNNNYLQTIFLI